MLLLFPWRKRAPDQGGGGTRRQRAALRGGELGHLADAPRYDQAANADR